jgi:hypothetical protein
LGATSFAQSNGDWVNPDHTSETYPGFKTGWFVGGDAGATLFYGDVALYNNFPRPSDWGKSTGSGISLYGGKKFKKGLVAEVQVWKGTLLGMKEADKLYPRYFRADLMDYSVNFKYNLSQELFREKQHRKLFNRLTVYLTAGVGQTFFRSRLYKQANNKQWYLENAEGYSTMNVDSGGVGVGGGLVTQKKAMVSAIIAPVGSKLNFKLNNKTDIVLDLRYVTVFSDKIDGWVRTWTHYDRYAYLGLGLNYNLGKKSEADVPDDQRYLFEHKKTASAEPAAGEDAPIVEKPAKKGLFGKRKAKNDKDLEIRLKMYELQLKLFEMQYLMGG